MNNTYIGLFTVIAPGSWHVTFPDLPGCDAWGKNFKEVFDAARKALADRLNVPLSKFQVNLDRYGNTSAAAVAIALDEGNRTGRFKVGDYILMVVFGGGTDGERHRPRF